MKLGITVRIWGPQSTRETIDACARLSDDAGLDSLWVNEHLAVPPEGAEGMDGGRFLEPMASIAYLAGVTRRQLHRLFSDHAGKPPSEFYRDLRLLHARSLLQHTAMPIAEIAAAAGFSSHAHLTGAYRARYARTPSGDRVRSL